MSFSATSNYSYSEFKELVNTSEQIPLVITNDIIRHGERTYPVKNISDIKVRRNEKKDNLSSINLFFPVTSQKLHLLLELAFSYFPNRHYTKRLFALPSTYRFFNLAITKCPHYNRSKAQ